MTNKLFRCSINRNLINKNDSGQVRFFSEGFVPAELTGHQLLDEVLQGHAFSYVFSGGRDTDNFEATDILAVDVDKGKTLPDALDNPFVLQNALFIYTTPSHCEAEHHYRIVFGLQETLTNVKDVGNVSRALIAQLKGDFSTTDGARLFFGCQGAWSRYIGHTLSPTLVDELRLRGIDFQNQRKLQKRPEGQPTLLRSHQVLDPSLQVTLRDGSEMAIADIKRNTSIFCPFHYDNNPSAFVDISHHSGCHYLHCRVCQVTWWTQR